MARIQNAHHVFDPLVGLSLRINEQTPALGVLNNDSILHRQIIIWQACDLDIDIQIQKQALRISLLKIKCISILELIINQRHKKAGDIILQQQLFLQNTNMFYKSKYGHNMGITWLS